MECIFVFRKLMLSSIAVGMSFFQVYHLSEPNDKQFWSSWKFQSSCSTLWLAGKVAVITGGARGIGAATAELFAKNGAHVVIADVLDQLGQTLADSIGGRYIHCDVSKESDMESAVNLALSWKGQLDIMVNNAGISGPDGSITTLDMDQLTSLLAINLNGTIHGIKHAARAMVEGGKGGCIICTTSTSAVMGGLAGHAYTMSKAAVLGLSRSSACELGVHGIRVNCISPHGIPSEMLVASFRKIQQDENVSAEDVSRVVGESGSLLRGRCGTFKDVANAALFVASDDSGFMTGHNLVIDGGFTSASVQLSFVYKC